MKYTFETALPLLKMGGAYTREAWGGRKFIIMKCGALFLVERTNDDLKINFKFLDNMDCKDLLATDWTWENLEILQPFEGILKEFMNGKSVVQVDPFIPRNQWHVIHPNPVIRHMGKNRIAALLKNYSLNQYSYWITFGGKNIYEEDLEEEPLFKKRTGEVEQ